MTEKVEKHLLISDLAEQPETVSEATPKQTADPEEINHCFSFLQAGQFAEAAKREARGKFSKPAFIAALHRERAMNAVRESKE